MATDVAAFLGYEGDGIEAEWGLVEEARRLADDFDLSAEFVCGSFVPAGGEDHVYRTGADAWFTTVALTPRTTTWLQADDFDLVYAYPWPGPGREWFRDLFEMYAGAGAVLLTCKGGRVRFRLRRKVGLRKRRRK